MRCSHECVSRFRPRAIQFRDAPGHGRVAVIHRRHALVVVDLQPLVLEAQAPVGQLAELVDHVARLLSPHKRPREVRWLDELPRNAMGKVVKNSLTQ